MPDVHEEVLVVLQGRDGQVSALQEERRLRLLLCAAALAGITLGTVMFCSMISMNNFSDCVIAPCEPR